MVKASTNLRGEELFIKDSGETTRCKARGKLISGRVNSSIQASGNLTSTMAGAFFTQTLSQTRNGFHTKGSSRTESSKGEAR